MRIARFSLNNQPRYAFVQKDEGDGRDYLVELDGYPLQGQPVQPTGERFALDAEGVRLLSPVIPSKIFGLACNYRRPGLAQSAASTRPSLDEMTVFMKPSTSVIGPDDPIVFPAAGHDLGYEPELVVIMGRMARNVAPAQALDYVLGFTCGNDLTLRDVQQQDPMWTRAKGFDTSCPLGPWIETDFSFEDARIEFELNGRVVEEASGSTADMVYSIPEQIAYISSFSTLLPGDAILTGFPGLPGSLHSRDEALVRIEGIGDLRNVVLGGE